MNEMTPFAINSAINIIKSALASGTGENVMSALVVKGLRGN